MEKVLICPDVHCRSFYKPLLNIKNIPIIFLGDYMDPYYFDGVSDEDGIANLEEIFDFARNNKNITLLAGNHDEEWIWSNMGFNRTSYKYYKDLHKLYRDNIDLLHPIYKLKDTIFTHAGISEGWINLMNKLILKGTFKLNEENIISYIEDEWKLELQNDVAPNTFIRYACLNSLIFCIGESRGGEAPYGGPFWNDFYVDHRQPEGWTSYQIFGHQQGSITGLVRIKQGCACLDSRAIFEYDLENHYVKPSKLNNNFTKTKIPDNAWTGGKIEL